MAKWRSFMVILLVIVICCSGCIVKSGQKEAPGNGGLAQNDPPSKVAPDLSNITNKDMFDLSEAAKSKLVENGFVVVPSDYREFFTLYEMSRYEPVPLFVTTDSMLHNYHLFFNHLLKAIETDRLIPELKKLNQAMLLEAQKQYAALKDTAWENAAKRNMGFFAVGARLMDASVAVPPEVQNEVAKELDLIARHEGIAVSPLMNMGGSLDPVNSLKEDYSQYIPRGHYEKLAELKGYFKAMMWYGRQTFRLKNEDETKSAVLIALALSEDDNALSWDKIYEPTSFFVGKSDDISYLQLKEQLDQVYGPKANLSTLVADQNKWTAFRENIQTLEPPAVNSIPIFDETIQPDREKEIKGFRFMGQRFTLDAAIFQRLVYREVKENNQGERRMLPKGLDIAAAFGSKEAYSILDELGETDYELYRENMAKLQKHLTDLSQETWTQNLYWSWLYTLQPLTQVKSDKYPAFMQNRAWARKELSTFLGSWAELKHDTVLYAKQVYAEAGGGNMDVDDRGYVEPNPLVFGRLAALAKTTREGLQARQLICERDAESLQRLEQLSLSLKEIAEKELTNEALTDDEYELIRSYGVQLEHFWLEALRDEGIEHHSQAYDQPAAIVTDVATDVGGQVLQEATGFIQEIYAAVPVDGKLRLAIGGVYSYYEFAWPLSDRLTDSRWRELLNAGEVPPQPNWTEAFIAP
ncbi:MAG: DUF3160 domain-containing protein [bacterium]